MEVNKSFRRRPGTASQHGADFQYQVAALLLARALNMAEDVRLASDAEFAGDFDDVVLCARLAGRPLLLAVQLKHKKGERPSVVKSALSAASGDFSVRKYYSSFLRVDHGELGARPEDAYYALFTNAYVPGQRAEAAVHAPPALLRLLAAGCAPGDVLRLSDGYLAQYARGPEFLARLLVCRNQADGDLLTELIRQELALHLGRSPPDLRARADALVQAVGAWWQRDGEADYLTADWPPWKAALADADGPPPAPLPPAGLLRRAAEANRLTAAAAAAAPGSCLLVPAPAEDFEARVAQCLQAGRQRRSVQVALASRGAEQARDAALSLWQRSWGRELALVLPPAGAREEGEGGCRELARRLLGALEGSERVLLLVAGPGIDAGRPADASALVQLISTELEPRGLWQRLDPSVSLPQLRRQAALREKEHPVSSALIRETCSGGGADRHGEDDHSASPVRNVQKVLVDRTASFPPDNRQPAADGKADGKAVLAASRRRDMDLLSRLLLPPDGPNPDLLTCDHQGDTALHLAAKNWEEPAVKLLIKAAGDAGQLAELLAARNRRGDQPAHVAAGRNNPAVVRALAEAGADLAAPGAGGATPLHVACRGRKYKQLCLLTELFPEAAVLSDDAGNTPLHLALSLAEDREDDARLPPADDGPWRLVVVYETQAAEGTWLRDGETRDTFKRPSNRAQLAKKVLAASPRSALEARNARGDTPLHSAARGRRQAAEDAVRVSVWSRGLVQELLRSGADPGATNGAGERPADLAARVGAEELARLLQPAAVRVSETRPRKKKAGAALRQRRES